MFCENCGSPLPELANFCTGCGGRVRKTSPPAPVASPPAAAYQASIPAPITPARDPRPLEQPIDQGAAQPRKVAVMNYAGVGMPATESHPAARCAWCGATIDGGQQ